MNDTSPEIGQMQFEMMMALGPARRVELACEMSMAARSFILASLPKNLAADELRRALAEKMNGRELLEEMEDV